MDILLLVVTIVSLLMALFFGVAAWGMWREERARSAARIAALAAAADEGPAGSIPTRPAAAPPAAASVKPAPWTAPPDWRRLPKVAPAPPAGDAVRDAFLGSTLAAPPSSGRQRYLAVAASVLLVVLSGAAYLTIDGSGARAAAVASSAAPLELISLAHERAGGALHIKGLVRNPISGARVEHLSAVAFLFNQQGELVASSRARVDFTQLTPGDESPFVIRLDAPANVARYRVSFRTDAGVVPHVDRRGQEPIPSGRDEGQTMPVAARDLP
jgi:hypothetical protein